MGVWRDWPTFTLRLTAVMLVTETKLNR